MASLNGTARSSTNNLNSPRVIPDLSKLIPSSELNNMETPNGSLSVVDGGIHHVGADNAVVDGSGDSNGSAPSPNHNGTNLQNPQANQASQSYEDPSCDLNAITRSQMEQDLAAYRYDLTFCEEQLSSQPDLTPQEIRTLQIRILDCGHNIRHCRHRIQTMDAQARQERERYQRQAEGVALMIEAREAGMLGSADHYRRHQGDIYSRGATGRHENSGTSYGGGHGNGAGASGHRHRHKRHRIEQSDGTGDARTSSSPTNDSMNLDGDDANESIIAVTGDGDGNVMPSLMNGSSSSNHSSNTLQRLGYWDCRLCKSRKFLDAGPSRVPSAPSKWPLKDISKLMNHFLDLHAEHTPKERCVELGDALARNRGPFEYWLTRTKAQELESPQVIDDYISSLQHGVLPENMRGLLRAAAAFPNAAPTVYKQR
ncbi:hypothetical protein F5Y16DRAFT_93040 [Xylariaceae sp. FL0255]|nr:hypothetical protein F5Y16DRAFT_93040 [Xylariaceae sp. FL0255]